MKEFGIQDSYEGIFIIVLCSKWCKSCKLFPSILEKFCDKNFIRYKVIDIDENINLVRKFNINAVPALLFFKNGKLLKINFEINGEIFVNEGLMVGTFSEQILKDVINQI